jgi:predicted nucleic acid-binding protein
MNIVIDASVLADFWVKSRPRHFLATNLSKYINKTEIEVYIPMHAILEVKSAIDNERQTPGRGILASDVFSDKRPLKLRTIPIDQAFIKDYFDLTIPYIKAGDLPYILIAKKLNCLLITEDNKQYNVAAKTGVPVYTIKEFLAFVGIC